MGRIVAVAAPLLDMEHVVFDIRLHAVSGFERFQIADHREGIGRPLVDTVVCYKLVLSGYLHIILYQKKMKKGRLKLVRQPLKGCGAASDVIRTCGFANG